MTFTFNFLANILIKFQNKKNIFQNKNLENIIILFTAL